MSFLQAAAIQGLATERIRKEAEKQGKSYTDMAKIGGAAVVGGTLIGLTGGLAVPAVIALTGLVGGAVGVGGGLAAAMAGATGEDGVGDQGSWFRGLEEDFCGCVAV